MVEMAVMVIVAITVVGFIGAFLWFLFQETDDDYFDGAA